MSAYAAYNCKGGVCTLAKKPKPTPGGVSKKAPAKRKIAATPAKTIRKKTTTPAKPIKKATTAAKTTKKTAKTTAEAKPPPKSASKSTARSTPKPATKSTGNKARTNGTSGKSNPASKVKVAKCAPAGISAAQFGLDPKQLDHLIDKYITNGKPAKTCTPAEQVLKEKVEAYVLAQMNGLSTEGDTSFTDSFTGGYDSEEGSYDDEYDSEYDSEEYDSEEGSYESGNEEDSYTDSYMETTEESGTDKVTALVSEILNRGGANLQDKSMVTGKKRKGDDNATEGKKNAEAKATTSTETAKKCNGTFNLKKAKLEEAKTVTSKVKGGRKSMPASLESNAPKVEKGAVCYRHEGPPQSASTPQTKKPASKAVAAPSTAGNNVVKMDSVKEGQKVFQWLLDPITVDTFFSKYWEKNACLISRSSRNYFSSLISFEMIGQMMLKNHVEFTKNIDITSYKNGVRETLNPDGRAFPSAVWDFYQQGCSVRLLNPQTFLPSVFKLNSTLQEYFHCFVGANVYLTPPNSQGFAPHYDDIEAFVLQIEGRKRWKLYKPRNDSEVLPRYSSPNFNQKEIGKPIFEQVLHPGDLLYFPRGTIHQASTEPGYHSLHITLSVYQRQSYADLLDVMMPLLAKAVAAASSEVRRGLPLHIWHNAGLAFSGVDSKERADLLQNVAQILSQSIAKVDVDQLMDQAVDQLAKKYQHEALPPEIQPAELPRTIFGVRSSTNDRGEYNCEYKLDLRTNVRLLRANIMRLVREESRIYIYYYLDNSKEYCEYEPNYLEIEPAVAGSVEVLIRSYPEYVGVSQLPLLDDEAKINVATLLWERGLLMMEKPFK